MKIYLSVLFILTLCACRAHQSTSISKLSLVQYSKVKDAFPLAENNQVVPIIVDEGIDNGLAKIVDLFRNDIKMVTGVQPELGHVIRPDMNSVIIIGVAGQSTLLDELEQRGKISLDDIKGKWETSLIQVVDHPFAGIDKVLVIAGSDKRGAIFGLFELSKQMGVSPWYWWADVPVLKRNDVYVKNGRYNFGEPKVQYRGIFINDEEPALGSWSREKFGGTNSKFYEKVFELILRLKGNYLWPAMWASSFSDDDPANAILADEMGVVIGYSHHEPMMRSHREWKKYGDGEWNYATNKSNLLEFWKGGIRRNIGKESIVTIGMRGDGDEPMSKESNVNLLTQIINDQRQIITEETGEPASKTPQVWALYKEVQGYYDLGMRVDEDITLLYCDDNWGNVRRLPGEEERKRKGGCGLYYHFDYVGDPRNYKWINTNPLPRVWEQNKLAYEYGVDKLWIVNVGDIKPMELPIQFYLDLAWNPDAIGTDELQGYTKMWAEQQFGNQYKDQIASILDRYGKYAGRVKPELLNSHGFSTTNYREYERVANELNLLCMNALAVKEQLGSEKQDAYFQLVLYPVQALSNIYNLYHALGKNHLYYTQQRALTNLMADSVEYYFKRDSVLKYQYNHKLANGKWNHLMDQTKFGYTSWYDPKTEILPHTYRLVLKKEALPEILLEDKTDEFGVIKDSVLSFDKFNDQNYFIEIYNKGITPFQYHIKSDCEWIVTTKNSGEILDQEKIFISVDWAKVGVGAHDGRVSISCHDKNFSIKINAWNPSSQQEKDMRGFVETNGYISFEASHFSKSFENDSIKWMIIPDMGLTLDGVTTKPALTTCQVPGTGPYLDYEVYFRSKGKVKVYAYFSPTLNFANGEGLKYAISFDGESPQVVNAHKNKQHNYWQKMVSKNINVCVSEHQITTPGNNKLTYHMISPGLVLQKIVIDTGGLKNSKLGPNEVMKTNSDY